MSDLKNMSMDYFVEIALFSGVNSEESVSQSC